MHIIRKICIFAVSKGEKLLLPLLKLPTGLLGQQFYFVHFHIVEEPAPTTELHRQSHMLGLSVDETLGLEVEEAKHFGIVRLLPLTEIRIFGHTDQFGKDVDQRGFLQVDGTATGQLSRVGYAELYHNPCIGVFDFLACEGLCLFQNHFTEFLYRHRFPFCGNFGFWDAGLTVFCHIISIVLFRLAKIMLFAFDIAKKPPYPSAWWKKK